MALSMAYDLLATSFYGKGKFQVVKESDSKRILFGDESRDDLDFDESEGSEESDIGISSESEWEEEELSDDGEDNLIHPLPTRRGRVGGRVLDPVGKRGEGEVEDL